MTYAICIRCGGEKFGAFTLCRSCGFVPATDDDIAKSLMVSDHHFGRDRLLEIGAAIAAGQPMEFDAGNVAALAKSMRGNPLIDTQRRLATGMAEGAATPAPRKPWWKIFGR